LQLREYIDDTEDYINIQVGQGLFSYKTSCSCRSNKSHCAYACRSTTDGIN